MSPVLAARYDTAVELGGGWRRTLRRRTTGASPVDLAMTTPVRVRVWGRQGATDDRGRELAPVVDAAGLVSADRLQATLTLSAAQVREIGVGQWEHAITVTDPASGDLVVLARGYLSVYGSIEREW